MSVSAGSAASGQIASWQKTSSTSSTRGQSFDPLAELMKAAGGGDKPSKASGKGAPGAPFGQDMMAQLIALQQQASESGNTGASDPGNGKLFAKLDTDGNSAVSKAEFEAAASKKGVSADITNAVFAKIDTDGDGAISQNELAAAEKAGGPDGAHHPGGPGGGGEESDKGAKTTTTVNADHSVTTTITYADGSCASTTSPPPASGNSGSTDTADATEHKSKNGGNAGADLFRQLAELQKQLMNAATTTAVSALI